MRVSVRRAPVIATALLFVVTLALPGAAAAIAHAGSSIVNAAHATRAGSEPAVLDATVRVDDGHSTTPSSRSRDALPFVGAIVAGASIALAIRLARLAARRRVQPLAATDVRLRAPPALI